MKFSILHIFFYHFFLLIFISIVALSCKEERKQDKPDYQKLKEPLMRINKTLVESDSELIAAFVARRNWQMNVTRTGLWYRIYENGKGEKAKAGNRVMLKYKLWLLDGTLCYSSDSLGVKIFNVGKSKVEAGLTEGVQLMRKGDKAQLIMPPHLAFGLIGDQNCIEGRAIIMYDIELFELYNE